MAKSKPAKPKDTDPEQSEKFLSAVERLRAAGVLQSTDEEAAGDLDRLLKPRPRTASD